MNYSEIYPLAQQLSQRMIHHRRTLHSLAETGFDTVKSADYIQNTLNQLGIKAERVCENGVFAHIGDNGAKSILLRCDIDALPVKEETGLDFSSENGCMHACGHDMHAAMLLGCAELLCKLKASLKGKATLLFQPAEELLQGANAVIKSGKLNLSEYGAAITLHVISPCNRQTGTVILPNGGIDAPSADFFKLTVEGAGCHGSSPWLGIDPISCICSMISGFDTIKAREVSTYKPFTLYTSSINAGKGFNVMPKKAEAMGSLRCFDENVRSFVKARMDEISRHIAKAYRCKAALDFSSGCPGFLIDKGLCDRFEKVLGDIFGKDRIFRESESSSTDTVKGSEDFSYFSSIIPCFTAAIPAGFEKDKAYTYQMHSPKVMFDENSLTVGCSVFSACALDFLQG